MRLCWINHPLRSELESLRLDLLVRSLPDLELPQNACCLEIVEDSSIVDPDKNLINSQIVPEKPEETVTHNSEPELTHSVPRVSKFILPKMNH